MKGQEVLARLCEIRDKILEEARRTPGLGLLAEKAELEEELGRLEGQFADWLKKEKKKTQKYEALLNEKPKELLDQEERIRALRDRAQILDARSARPDSQEEDLKAEIAALDESLGAVFKNYEIAKKRSKALQKENERLQALSELNNTGSLRSMEQFAFSKKGGGNYLTSRTEKLDWAFNSVNNSHSKKSHNS
jgi:hypothetical protein